LTLETIPSLSCFFGSYVSQPLRTAIFTSTQALLTSHLFGILAETSARDFEHRLARIVVWYALISFVSYPVASGLITLLLPRINAFYVFYSAQYMLQARPIVY
jgi:uncharacterized membrane protein YfcA